MRFTVHRGHHVGSTLVLSPKAQLVMSALNPEVMKLIEEFAELREDYLHFRDLHRINRITQWEIENGGLEKLLG